MKIVTVLGARPQFIKAATVSREFNRMGVHEIIVHTGQHYDHNMSQVFFDEMEIPHPNYHLEIQGLTHGAMTGRMLEKIEEVLNQEKPEILLVYGDTNSTLAGALAASKLNIPVAHVEAGLRSFNMEMPEEINRILTDRISHFLFCPTTTAVKNLEKEGFMNFPCEVAQCGDVMFDSVLFYKERISPHAPILRRENLANTPFVLATIHRAENTNDLVRLRNIVEALNDIHQAIEVVIPLHPRTKAFLSANNIWLSAHIIEPVGYFDMLALLQNCHLVLTDSGGLQKESYFFEKYCITLRDQTEWMELVDLGVNSLAGADTATILNLFEQKKNEIVRLNPSTYGDGKAAQKIVAKLLA